MILLLTGSCTDAPEPTAPLATSEIIVTSEQGDRQSPMPTNRMTKT